MFTSLSNTISATFVKYSFLLYSSNKIVLSTEINLIHFFTEELLNSSVILDIPEMSLAAYEICS